ncbi:MAG: hypothetical protein IJD75_04600 [Clostridia bacterium]|nr:hypothetical protein [Clostridia bacterium]
MSRNQNKAHRALIHLCYLLPAIFGILLLIYAAVPHLWFVYDGDAYSTMNLFELQENAWEFYEQIKVGTVENSTAVTWFKDLLPVVSALFWILPILYALIATMITVCSIVAFSFEPTSRIANRTKRILHLICPNRVTYLLVSLLPLFSALFPQMLLLLYRMQGMSIRLYTFFLADWILVLIFAVLNAAAFILLLPVQSEEHLDMFRIYKSGAQVRRQGEEEI